MNEKPWIDKGFCRQNEDARVIPDAPSALSTKPQNIKAGDRDPVKAAGLGLMNAFVLQRHDALIEMAAVPNPPTLRTLPPYANR